MSQERAEDWDYQFSASVLEIYNERIYDLLAGGRDQDGDKLDVKQVRVLVAHTLPISNRLCGAHARAAPAAGSGMQN